MMKTSNKLLIVVAILVIVIPVIAVAVSLSKNYVNPKTIKDQQNSRNKFSTPSLGYTSQNLNAFNAISIADAKKLTLTIRIVKDDKFGIKIPDEFMEKMSYRINKNKLEIVFKNLENSDIYSTGIIIYSPVADKLSVGNGNILQVSTSADSLWLNVNKMGSVSFEPDSKSNIIDVNAKNVSSLNFDNESLNKLKVSLDNTSLLMEKTNVNLLKVNAKNKSLVQITGDDKYTKKYKIDDLQIETSGKSDLKLVDMNISKITGNLSDETILSMPATYFKKFLK